MSKSVIKLQRQVMGLTQKEVADHVGVQEQTILKWENGKNEPSCSKVPLLADLLKLSCEQICRNDVGAVIGRLEFMSDVAPILKHLDDVSAVSVMYDNVADKQLFINELHGILKVNRDIVFGD